MKRRSFVKTLSGSATASVIPKNPFEENHFHFSEPYRETRKEIIENLRIINDENYDMSKVYEEGSKPDIVQGNLRTQTRSLVGYVERSLLRYGDFLDELDFEDSLTILSVVRDEFGENPFHNVLEGRVKEVVDLGKKYGKDIPEEFKDYLDIEIHDFENPHLDYRTLDDLRQSTSTYSQGGYQFIPPENRTIEDHKKIRRIIHGVQ